MEYLISSASQKTEEWQNNILSHNNLKIRYKSPYYMLIKCNNETIEQLKIKNPLIKAEEIFSYDDQT